MKSFEEKILRLEEIVEILGEGNLSLAKMRSLFKAGIKLKAELDEELKSAREEIEILSGSLKENTEMPSWNPFPRKEAAQDSQGESQDDSFS